MNTQALTVRLRACAALAITSAALTGCAGLQEKPLYYWGDYQPAVYSYFKKQEGPQAQIGKLEATAQKAQSQNMALPPGFNAHLGLLYLQSGQAGKAQSAFVTEKTRFPESTAYMDFLLKKPAAPAPIVAKPAAAPAAKPAAQKSGSAKK